MDEIELYFVNDKPMHIYGSNKSIIKPFWSKIPVNDTYYYIAPAVNYKIAIEYIRWIIADSVNSIKDQSAIEIIQHGLSQIIDITRGDGATFMLLDIIEWGSLLDNYKVPEIYK